VADRVARGDDGRRDGGGRCRGGGGVETRLRAAGGATRAEARGVPPVVAGAPPPPTVTPRTARPDRVARQTIDRAAAAAEVVAITPVAIVPLADDGAGLEEMEPTRVVEIAPIDVEPVRISELGELVE
jgi:hypothetical protein